MVFASLLCLSVLELCFTSVQGNNDGNVQSEDANERKIGVYDVVKPADNLNQYSSCGITETYTSLTYKLCHEYMRNIDDARA